MPRFTLHWLDGETDVVEGKDIADACEKADIDADSLSELDYFYGEDGKAVQVAGEAPCNCAHNFPCHHDLEIVGLISSTQRD